jgi:hypothetical protein
MSNQQEHWEQPEFWHCTILAYIHSTSKEEFELLPMDDMIHIPVLNGQFVISKQDLLLKAKEEAEEYNAK